MFIETEATPNPATLKFLPGRDVLGDRGTADFTSTEEAAGRSPLAERLFGLGDVARVFLANAAVGVQHAHRSPCDDDGHHQHGLWSTTTKPAKRCRVAFAAIGPQQQRRGRRQAQG